MGLISLLPHLSLLSPNPTPPHYCRSELSKNLTMIFYHLSLMSRALHTSALPSPTAPALWTITPILWNTASLCRVKELLFLLLGSTQVPLLLLLGNPSWPFKDEPHSPLHVAFTPSFGPQTILRPHPTENTAPRSLMPPPRAPTTCTVTVTPPRRELLGHKP